MFATVRQALRALGRSPGFTLAALATFAIGIGANATVFGVVNAVLLRSYPFAEPDRLVALSETQKNENDRPFPIAPANFHDWRQQAKGFTAMAAVSNTDYTLRTDGEPAALSSLVRRTVSDLDPTLSVADVRPMRGVVLNSTARPRFSALLLGAFASCAVVLALVGIYGVVAQSVAQRAAEFSVRVALGAQPRDVWRDVLGGSLRRAAIGIALGLAAAAGLTRLLADELYDTSPLDPPVLAAVSLVVALVAALASWVPARRAMRASPMAVLRAE